MMTSCLLIHAFGVARYVGFQQLDASFAAPPVLRFQSCFRCSCSLFSTSRNRVNAIHAAGLPLSRASSRAREWSAVRRKRVRMRVTRRVSRVERS